MYVVRKPVHENDRRFRPGVISDVDPVLVPLNKSLLVGHHSLGLNAPSGASRMSATNSQTPRYVRQRLLSDGRPSRCESGAKCPGPTDAPKQMTRRGSGYSITSSARASSVGGISMPIDLAIL